MKISKFFGTAAFVVGIGIATLGSAVAGPMPKTAIFVDNSSDVTAYPLSSKGDVAPLALTTDMISPGGIARDAIGRIYITNTSTNTVTIYAANANGNVPPLAVIGGALTHLASPTAIALDASGKIYVLNIGTSAITVYPPLGSNGNILNEAPIASISGANSKLDQPVAIAVDGTGDIYIADQSGGPATPGGDFAPGAVTFYPAGSSGNVAPTARIVGSATELFYPASIALDANGDIYVGNGGISFSQALTYPPSITVYPAGSSGNVAPSDVISGSNTGLDDPQGIAVDRTGNIYAASFTTNGNAIEVFAAASNGNVSPAATIVGTDTGLSTPDGIVVDSVGNVYVSNRSGGPIGNGLVTIYPAGSNGDPAPMSAISSNFIGVHFSNGIATDSIGRIYVTNDVGGPKSLGSIAVYGPGGYVTGPPRATITGDDTGLHFPSSIALDANDNISVLNSNNTITTYHTGGAGDVAPRETLNIDRSGNNAPAGLAVNAGGAIYVVNRGVFACAFPQQCRATTLGSIAIFPAGSRGNANPSVVISGPDTKLASPTAIAVSNRGNVFVTNEGVTCLPGYGCFPGGLGTITVYAYGSEANAKPIATIGGPRTGLGFPRAIAVDSSENIYVLNGGSFGGGIFLVPGVFYLPGFLDFGNGNGPLLIFKAGSNGDVAPIATIGGPLTGIEGTGIAIGPTGP